VKEMKQVIAEYMGHYNHIRPQYERLFITGEIRTRKNGAFGSKWKKSLGIRKW